MEICEYKICTGCGACVQACAKKCITLSPDELDALHPVVNERRCSGCGLCVKACPNNYSIDFHKTNKVYAAWSKDDTQRRTSASGGVAAELYKYALSKGWRTYGVVYTREKGCHFVPVSSEVDLMAAKISKYCYSDLGSTYKQIKTYLKNGESVLFIGLPCQVSGLYSFLGGQADNLITIDLLCHGSVPQAYLQQHVASIEKRKKDNASDLCFRDPKYYTFTFTFTLKNSLGKEIYKNVVDSSDNYQLGYHHALIYRENCYNCKYARSERVSDLTIGDYYGIGLSEVNCVLINTEKGEYLLSNVKDSIELLERPIDEIFKIEHQLQAPSIPHPMRELFVATYKATSDFEKSCDACLAQDKRNAFKKNVKKLVKSLVKKIMIWR